MRYNNEECLIVINSFDDTTLNLDLSKFEINELILSNYKDLIINNHTLTLRPYESVVLKVEEKL